MNDTLYRAGLPPLLPLKPGTNRPAISNWQNAATSDDAQLDAWQREIPGCNWGIRVGQGLGVLDLDTKNAPEGSFGGFGSLIDVQEQLALDLSNLPMVSTFSGAHLYFRYDGELRSRVPWLPGIDVKADGGHQVAAPGTVRVVNGVERVYELVRGDLSQIPLAPISLLDAIRSWRYSRRGTGGAFSPGARLPTTREALRDGLPAGSRNDFMHRLACRWWSKLGLHAEIEVKALAFEVWQATADQAGFPWSEVERAVRSAREFLAREDERNRGVLSRWLRAMP